MGRTIFEHLPSPDTKAVGGDNFFFRVPISANVLAQIVQQFVCAGWPIEGIMDQIACKNRYGLALI